MKRLGDTNSHSAFMSICQTSEEQCPRNGNNGHVYSREFQSILEGLDEEECGHVAEKKRRLGVEQVKALEKSFEVENKLEPDRKVQLAHDLGLQPRQVAVWFQNRRARWKTKQLERDYNVLKANFDSLKHNFESLNEDKQALLKQIGELKSKLVEDGNTESDLSVKDETTVPESDNNLEHISEEEDQEQPAATYFGSSETNFFNTFNNDNGSGLSISVFKDGSSDSDSSAILNEDSNSPSVAGILMYQTQTQTQSQTQTQFVKLEEHDFFSGEEACNFFSDDQPPTLQQWYCPDPWNPS